MNNNENQYVTIKLAEYYPKNCSDQKYVNVTKMMENCIQIWKIKEESRARKDRRYKLQFFDEVLIGECEKIYTPSFEKDICGYTETELLYMAIENLPEYEKNLITLHYFNQVKMLDLAEKYGISNSAIGRHIKKARDMIKKFMLIHMQK